MELHLSNGRTQLVCLFLDGSSLFFHQLLLNLQTPHHHDKCLFPGRTATRLSSLRFDGRFPGGPELAATVPKCLHYGAWITEMVVTTGAIYKTCKTPVKSSPPTNQHPTFCRSDALPVARTCQSTERKSDRTICRARTVRCSQRF